MAGSDLFHKADTPSEVSVTPAITVGSYADGQLIGDMLTFVPLVSSSGEGYIEKFLLIDKAQQDVDALFFLFNEEPVNTSFVDQSAFSVASADLDKVCGVISITGPTDYVQDGSSSFATYDLGLPVDGAGSTVYGALVSDGSATFGSTDDVIVKLLGRY